MLQEAKADKILKHNLIILIYVTQASAASQQIQSVSVCKNSDQVTVQSSRCKLSVENSSVLIY